MQPPDSIPLLQFHYRTFIARTDRSAPVLHIGTLASWLQPLVLLPLHWSDWFLQFRLKACVKVTPPFTPVAACPVIRTPTGFSQRFHSPLVLTTSDPNDA